MLGRTVPSGMMSGDGEHRYEYDTSSLMLHPSVLPKAPSTVVSEDDRLLAVCVRRHLFDFAMAAQELRQHGGASSNMIDASWCRQRWSQLDLHACAAFSEAAPVEMEVEAVAPSGFNIFHNSLGQQMSSIFGDVRATLPSLGDIAASSSDDEEGDQKDVCDDSWALLDESDVSNFASRMPAPALSFPFELDDFQKRALLRLEQEA